MEALNITSKNFEAEVIGSDIPVLLDFWASWCGPCKMVSPILEEVAKEKKDTIKVCKINIDEEIELAKAFHIMSIPTLVVVNEGKVVKTSIGLRPKKDILSLINLEEELVSAAEDKDLDTIEKEDDEVK
jgi:thioredoxin 1